MKNLFSTIIFTLLFASSLLAQDEFEFKSSALRINPVSFINSEFQVAYEKYFGNRSSSIIIAPSVILKETQQETKEGWKVMAQYRFYLTHFTKEKQNTFLNLYNYGFYAAGYALYYDYSEDYQMGFQNPLTGEYEMDQFTKEITASEGGALLGLEVDVTNRIQFDFFIGGGIRYSEIKDSFIPGQNDYVESYGVFDPEFQGVKPKLGFMLGITF